MIPDYAEPLRAFRVWRLDVRIPEAGVPALSGPALPLRAAEPQLLLRSRNGWATWQPGRNVAECRWFDYGPPSWPEKAPTGEPHEAPQRECGCGLYAAFEPPPPKLWSSWDERGCHLLVYMYVSGLVEAWGRIIEHESGVRAQYGRVIALADPGPALRLSEADGRSVATLVRRTAAVYEAAYVEDPFHLKTIHTKGLDWFREHEAELEVGPTSGTRE